MKRSSRDAVACLSLANLLWLPAWNLALDVEWNPFFLERNTAATLLGAMTGVCGTALFLWIARQVTTTYKQLQPAGIAGFLLLSGVAANHVRAQIPALTTNSLMERLGANGLATATMCIAVGMAWLVFRRARELVHGLLMAILLLTPFAFFTLSQAAFAVASHKQKTQPNSSGTTGLVATGPRVVLVLFDEMDRDVVALGAADAPERLPALSRFYRESIHFDGAVAPVGKGAVRTLTVVPSLTLGRTVVASEPKGPSELALTYSDGETGLWSQPSNLFRVARKEGFNSFLAGWYLPYCRLFSAELAECHWRAAYPPPPQSVGAALSLYTPLFWRSLPGLNRAALSLGWRAEDTRHLRWHGESFDAIHSRALEGVRDQRMQLVFLHYPVPHLAPTGMDRGDWAENLALADRALRDLRESLEVMGGWDEAAFIVLSDHGRRDLGGERHPILMVKLPHSGASFAVGERTPLERVYFLVLGLLRGQILTAEHVFAAMSSNIAGPPVARAIQHRAITGAVSSRGTAAGPAAPGS